ncbi:MAG: peptidoglycan bridge formation glycyltransferase FemA/FemB family protein [Deltaproteobacteria bacterium]|nr:peptidoglycan bridge formation glycyltransferase FemA/FemB family protein [Deltaproteobacteria bacterium]
MPPEISRLNPADSDDWTRFIQDQPAAMVYHSLTFKQFLEDAIGGEPVYLVARRDGRVVGVLPAWMSEDLGIGRVINSLPFFGSNGSVLAENQADAAALFSALDEMARDTDCLTATIVSNPYQPAAGMKALPPGFSPLDSRVCQVTPLPEDGPDLEARLMTGYEGRTRTAIRKARKEGVNTMISNGREELRVFHRVHQESITFLGGVPKPLAILETLIHDFGDQAEIIYAVKERELLAGAIFLFFQDKVEYYTVFSRPEARPRQPLSLVVLAAMHVAAQRGCRFFSFGGTWPTQLGVSQFKQGFGAQGRPYSYYIKLYRDLNFFKQLGREKILKYFPWFYVIPFGLLG